LKLNFYTLWAINARLDERELCRQLDAMRAGGFDGVVFHPRYYPDEPPYLSDAYLSVLSRIILHAKSIGLAFWIYDENGWPSGTVGGELLKQFPADAQQWADLVLERPAPADYLGGFEHCGQNWFVGRRRGEGVDYFNPELARHFIQMTHERYRQGLSPAAFAHVSAFFCDEPEFGLGHAYDRLSPHGAIPWTPRLPELFRARHGEALQLSQIFFAGDGGEMRVKFWELLTDIFNESFIAPLDEWCRAHGKRFTAHVKGEEHPLFQVPTSGSCHQVFQRMALPGIDALERYPSGDFFPRQVASVAKQFGSGECLVECFGGAGWGASPEDFENYLNWLAGHGLTHFVTHLWQYRLTTHAIQDWPPSHPAHVNWRELYPLILARVRERFSAPPPVADTLVVAPYRGIMAKFEPREFLQTNVHNAATYPDSAAGKLNAAFLQLLERVHKSGANYDVSDERTIEAHGKVKDGILHLGRCAYRQVVLASGVKFNADLTLLPIKPETGGFAKRVILSAAEPTDEIAVPVAWEIQPGTINDFVLEAAPAGRASFLARFAATAAFEAELYFADDVRNVEINGIAPSGDGKFRCAPGWNEIRFICQENRVPPFLALRGSFAVCSKSLFAIRPDGLMTTEGGFALDKFKPGGAGDLIASCFPFCREPVVVRVEINLPTPARALRFVEIQADGARVLLDGTDCGWCWGAAGSLKLPKEISTGRHVIEVQLIPSTFNFFGPHHHVDGDRHIVSPAQFHYTKNFADRPDAPADTRVSAWHFKPFGIGATILIQKECEPPKNGIASVGHRQH